MTRPRTTGIVRLSWQCATYSAASPAISSPATTNRGRLLREETVDAMLRPNDVAGRQWGLGWGVRTKAVPGRPDLPVFGHLGYTGTSVRFSPELDLLFVFLSNRVHPKDPGSLRAIVSAIRRVWDVAVEAVDRPEGAEGRAVERSPRRAAR